MPIYKNTQYLVQDMEEEVQFILLRSKNITQKKDNYPNPLIKIIWLISIYCDQFLKKLRISGQIIRKRMKSQSFWDY